MNAITNPIFNHNDKTYLSLYPRFIGRTINGATILVFVQFQIFFLE